MKVVIFVREQNIDGIIYPRTAPCPPDLFSGPKRDQLLRVKILAEVDIEEMFSMLGDDVEGPNPMPEMAMASLDALQEEAESNVKTIKAYKVKLVDLTKQAEQDEIDRLIAIVEADAAAVEAEEAAAAVEAKNDAAKVLELKALADEAEAQAKALAKQEARDLKLEKARIRRNDKENKQRLIDAGVAETKKLAEVAAEEAKEAEDAIPEASDDHMLSDGKQQAFPIETKNTKED